MRQHTPIPAATPLPIPHARAQHRRHQIAGIDLSGIDVAHFNDVLHELNPDAPHLDSDAIASVGRWLAALPAPQADAMLQARLGRLDELRSLLLDGDWRVDSAIRHRIERLLAYGNHNDALIPESQPFIGRLDYALLVELAWPTVADELDDYRDFCRFREESGPLYANHPDRDDWLRTRLEEGALWEHLHRVREHRYSDFGLLREGFHVV